MESLSDNIFLDSALDFLSNENPRLLDGYKNKQGTNPQDCLEIACDIARLFLAEGLQGNIIYFSGKLQPTPLPGMVWQQHFVFEIDGYVYDTIFIDPVPIESYSQKAFNRNIDYRTHMVQKNISKLSL